VIDANNPRAKVPQEFVEGGEIVFNISPSAIRDLKMLNDLVEFKASFSGIIHIISAPITAILAVYAEENGEGIFFDAEEDGDNDSVVQIPQTKGIQGLVAAGEPSLEQEITSQSSGAKSKPFLKLVE
jgi:stringent starvation protein B